MTVLNTARTSGDMPYVYIIGPQMLMAQLRPYAESLDQKVANKVTVHLLDADGAAGAEACEAFDIDAAQLPAVMLFEDDGSVYQDWYGEDLPDIEQLAYTIGQIADVAE